MQIKIFIIFWAGTGKKISSLSAMSQYINGTGDANGDQVLVVIIYIYNHEFADLHLDAKNKFKSPSNQTWVVCSKAEEDEVLKILRRS